MIAATDFFTVEVLTLGGLVRYVVCFAIDLESRRVHIAGWFAIHTMRGSSRSRATWPTASMDSCEASAT